MSVRPRVGGGGRGGCAPTGAVRLCETGPDVPQPTGVPAASPEPHRRAERCPRRGGGRLGHSASRSERRRLRARRQRSEEHTSELQSLMRISYAVFCLTTPKKPQAILYTYCILTNRY